MNETLNKKKSGGIELLAPAGGIDAGYAALHYGADAIYLGLENFSARASALNFSLEDLKAITGYAHSRPKKRKIYAAINTLILQNELGAVIDLLSEAVAIGIDAVIVQDFGALNILRKYFPQMKVHASTQMAIHNLAGVKAAARMGIKRVTLARELTLDEITEIASVSDIETEVFIHGALCYSYSGLCLFSSHLNGRSGNRGRCAYPCREWFIPEYSDGIRHNCEKDGGFIFSMKDLALPEHVAGLRRMGVAALKIEGRMKSPLYAAVTVNYYRHLLDGNLTPEKERELAAEVQTVFSRPWTDLYVNDRRKRGVTDTQTMGHRGSPAGVVEEIVKNDGGHALRFKTNLPLELHDGLQIDIDGQQRPFGFAVKNLNIMGSKGLPGRKRVFMAPVGAKVEIQLPRGHPLIPKGVVIYSASSQKIKQQYAFHRPKPAQFRQRHVVDFDVQVDETGCVVNAAANIPSVAGGGKIRVEAKQRYEGKYEPAENPGAFHGACAQSFGKLGNTYLISGNLTVHNPRNLFVPLSRLNAIRRDISAVLEEKIYAIPRKHAEKIKNHLICSRTIAESKITHKQTWSIKTDQAHLLEAFGESDWRNVDDVIIECSPGNPSGLSSRLNRLAAMAGRERLRLALPVIIRQWEMESLANVVSELISQGWRKWQVSGLGGLELLAGRNENKLHVSADWPLYAMNRAAVLEFEELGIEKFTLSPEDGLENMRALLAEFAEKATVVVYQDTPLMVSETCVFASEECSWPDKCNRREMIYSSERGEKIRVISRHCRSVVMNARPFCLAGRLEELTKTGALNLRADFIYRKYSSAELLAVWRSLRTGGKNISGHEGNFRIGI